jgi:hypothetical protein
MATQPRQERRSDDGVPPVNPDLKKSIDASYNRNQDGSSPIDTASVKIDEERNVWPIVWLVTAVLMILVMLYLIVG